MSNNIAIQPDYIKDQLNKTPDQFKQYDDLATNPLDFYTGNGEFNIQKFTFIEVCIFWYIEYSYVSLIPDNLSHLSLLG
jgi:hypothetical protein